MSSDPKGAFRTHANYIQAFAHLARANPATGCLNYTALACRVADSGVLAPRPSRAEIDLDQVRRSLNNAWGTEYLMAIGVFVLTDDELVALSNNWAVVQAYYAGYHAVQALAVAKKFPRPDSHPKTLNQYYSLWTNRPIQLAPWTLGAGSKGYTNLPEGRTIDEALHPWSACTNETRWDLACKALRTTREEAVKDALTRKREAKRRMRRQVWFREQREREESGRKPRKGGPPDTRPNLTAEEKKEVASGVREATLLDYLYRLRVKTNYVDSDMFTDGPESGADSWGVRGNIGDITSVTLLVHELVIGSHVGYDRIIDWAHDWTGRNIPPGKSQGLAGRIDVIRRFAE